MGAVEILLSNGQVTTIDDIDGDLAKYTWRMVIDKNHRTGYVKRYVSNRPLILEHLHRVILSRVIGRDLRKEEMVDHIDGNGLNNQRTNLRLCSHTENMRNRKRSVGNTAGFKGVTVQHGMYRAKIKKGGITYHLGCFHTAEEAHEAYCEAAKEMHGKFFNPG